MDEFDRLIREWRKVRRRRALLYLKHITLFNWVRIFSAITFRFNNQEYLEIIQKDNQFYKSYTNSKMELWNMIREILSYSEFKVRLKMSLWMHNVRSIFK